MEDALGITLVQRGQALSLRGREIVAGVGHGERIEDVFAEVVLQRRAGQFFDEATEPVDAGAIEPAVPWIKDQGPVVEVDLLGLGLFVLMQVGAPEGVAEAGGMREEVAERDWSLWRSELRCTVRVEAVEDLELVEGFGRKWLVEGPPTLFYELQGGDGGDRLGHGGNVEDGVEGHLG